MTKKLFTKPYKKEIIFSTLLRELSIFKGVYLTQMVENYNDDKKSFISLEKSGRITFYKESTEPVLKNSDGKLFTMNCNCDYKMVVTMVKKLQPNYKTVILYNSENYDTRYLVNELLECVEIEKDL